MLQVGSQRSEQPSSINFESIVRGLKHDTLIGTQSKMYKIQWFKMGGPMPDEVMKFFWNFSLTFSFFLWHQKGKLSKKERKYSKYKVVLFIRKQRLPTVSAILNIG